MELIIGTRRWSSWSLRAWLVAMRTGAAFSETLIPLYQHGVQPELARHSPSRMAPVLKADGLAIWDSLAIAEYLAERFPEARLWPRDPGPRALARSAAAEMHSGFQALREQCPMDLKRREPRELSAAAAIDAGRIRELWSQLLARSGGPFLLGAWSIADAFYTPIATRLRTYAIDLARFGDDGAAAAYAQRLLATDHFMAWEAKA